MYTFITRQKGKLRKTRRTRGTAMIEFLFVAPIMLILIAFVVDLGMAVYTKNALANATQASVRVASQRGGVLLDGRTVAADQFFSGVAGTPGMDPSRVTSYVAGPNLCRNGASTIEARAEYQYSFITPGLNAILDMISADGVGEGLTLRAASSLRCEIIW